MRAKKLGILAVGAGLVLTVAPVLAHHSFDAEFDRNKPVKVTGTVSKLEWMNPHIWFYVDVKNDAGAVEKWQFEGGPPNTLRRQGWTRESLKTGDVVTVEAFRAKDGTNTGNARSVVLASGQRVFAGSPDDGVASRTKE
jgi:hypothetical protein